MVYSKILALAIISTAVVPLDLLIAEAPPTPPSRDRCLPMWFFSLKADLFQPILLSHSIDVYNLTPPSCGGAQLPARGIYDVTGAIRFRHSCYSVLIICCIVSILLHSLLFSSVSHLHHQYQYVLHSQLTVDGMGDIQLYVSH